MLELTNLNPEYIYDRRRRECCIYFVQLQFAIENNVNVLNYYGLSHWQEFYLHMQVIKYSTYKILVSFSFVGPV